MLEHYAGTFCMESLNQKFSLGHRDVVIVVVVVVIVVVVVSPP